MTERPDGYYWVRGHGLDYFVPVLCIAGMWGECEDDRCPDYEYAEIGPPCSRDDSEQLAKARDTLRRLLRLADSSNDWLLKSVIEESGVRL